MSNVNSGPRSYAEQVALGLEPRDEYLEAEKQRQRVRLAKAEAARLGREAGVRIDWRLLANTIYDS